MVERVSGQGRGVLRRRRVLASVPALALALTVVGVSADGPAGVAAQGTTVAPVAVAGQLADETVAGRSSFSPGPESGSTDPLQVTAVSAMAAGAAGPRRFRLPITLAFLWEEASRPRAMIHPLLV